MLVKTFEGFSMKEAMLAVKQEFGSEAVILSTNEKKIDENGSKIVEVRAAVPESKSMGASKGPSHHQLRGLEEKIDTIDMKLNSMSDRLVSKDRIQSIESGLHELRLLFSEYLRTSEGTAISDLPKVLVPLYQHLKLMGLEQEHIAELLKFLKSIPEPEEHGDFENPEEFYKSHAMRWMLKRIIIAPRWNIIAGNTALHAFIGPSGSGKTTLLAKIAAHYKKNENAKVLIVSFDNQRVAASDQLRVYAKILDIPFETISDPNELEGKLLQHRNTEVALIDTAGRNPKDPSEINDLSALTELSLPINFHLTLTVTERQSQLDRAVRNFSQLGLESLMFTKLDESWTYGEIYNLSHKWSVPLGYFSSGQKIPGDFEKATRERVIERIFGL